MPFLLSLLVVVLAAQDPAALTESGREKLLKRDYAGAMADLDRAIAVDPNHAAAYYWRGRVRLMRDEADLGDLIKAVELGYDRPEAVAYAGYAKATQGRLDEALGGCDRALLRDGTNPDPAQSRAVVRGLRKEWLPAAADIDTAIRTQRRARYFLTRGWLSARKGDVDDALTACAEAIACGRDRSGGRHRRRSRRARSSALYGEGRPPGSADRVHEGDRDPADGGGPLRPRSHSRGRPRLRGGDRRLQRGDPARSGDVGRVEPSRARAARTGGGRRGHRGCDRDDPAGRHEGLAVEPVRPREDASRRPARGRRRPHRSVAALPEVCGRVREPRSGA